MEVIGFLACLMLWMAFAGLLVANREALDVVWRSFRQQPLVLQGAEGVVLLPWTVGLAVWESSWTAWLRLLLVAGVAFANLYAFFPWKETLGLR